MSVRGQGHTWTGIRHRKQERLCVLQLKVLILEFHSINTLTTSSIASRKVSTLNHELLDDSVEAGAFVGQGHTILCVALVTSAQSTEVLSSLGHNVRVKLKDDSAGWLSANRDVEVDTRTRRHGDGPLKLRA